MREADVTTRIVRVIEIPRSQLSEFIKIPEAQRVGMYGIRDQILFIGVSFRSIAKKITTIHLQPLIFRITPICRFIPSLPLRSLASSASTNPTAS